MLVYTEARVVISGSLFTVGTVTGVIVMLLVPLRLTSFLILYKGLEHGLHKSHALIAPSLLLGLLRISRLTSCCREGLTIAVIAKAFQGIVGLVRAAVVFATQAKLLTASLLRDSNMWAPRHPPLGITLGFGMGWWSLTLCIELLILFFNHDPFDSL
jgi:hypothetical protein